MRMFRAIIYFGLSFCLIANAYAEEFSALKAVETAVLKRKASSQLIHASGRLVHHTLIKLAFSNNGLVDNINVEVGDRIKAGQLLANLDLSEMAAQKNKAQANYDLALADWQRFTQLYTLKQVSLADIQRSKMILDGFKSDIDVIEYNTRLSKIYAPMSGVLVNKLVEEKELIKGTETALVIGVNKEGWIVKIELPDFEVVKLSLDDVCKVRFSAYPGEYFSGVIREIAETSNSVTGLFSVEIKLDKSVATFRNGYLATVEIQPQSQQIYSYIPLDSVVSIDDSKAVFFSFDPDSNIVYKKSTHIEFLKNDAVASRDLFTGVKELVTTGASYLKDAEKVTKQVIKGDSL